MKKRNFWQALTSKQHFVVFLMGISSGLPYLLIGSTLRLWFTNVGIDIKTIGASTLVMLPYTWKFIWAPILDRYPLPFLGRRRGWIILFQAALAISFFLMGQVSPDTQTVLMLRLATLCAFFSASQDIIIDAYRREILPDEELGLGSSLAVTGYRIGMLFATSLAPILSSHIPWGQVYTIMALIMATCMMATLFSDEPTIEVYKPKSLYASVQEPLMDFFFKPNLVLGGIFLLALMTLKPMLFPEVQIPIMDELINWGTHPLAYLLYAIAAFFVTKGPIRGVILFILLYKLGDSMASGLFKTFYSNIGYSNEDIGKVAGPIGIWAAIVGGIIGGSLQMKIGLKKCLWYFGILQALSTATFAILGFFAPSLIALGLVIFFETFTSGLGTAAYSSFMASLTNKKFTATQYALLTSIMSTPAILLGSRSGYIKDSIGWNGFFIFCALIAIPGILMLLKFDTWQRKEV
jgi:PAT family beta-lactamase induction signal transducer AmpG